MLIHSLLLVVATSATPSVVISKAGELPLSWSVIEQPKSDDDWQCANYSMLEWAVSGDSAQGITISPYEDTPQIKISLPDGDLIGSNFGEFGGSIEWVKHNSSKRVLIAKTNPVAFTQRGNDVYVAVGLAHLSQNDGNIIKLHRANNGSWQFSQILALVEAPSAATRVDDTTWVILTTNGVTKLDLSSLATEQIHHNENWGMLYANSIRTLGNSWLIGARSAVIRITPSETGYTEEWLGPVGSKDSTQSKRKCTP